MSPAPAAAASPTEAEITALVDLWLDYTRDDEDQARAVAAHLAALEPARRALLLPFSCSLEALNRSMLGRRRPDSQARIDALWRERVEQGPTRALWLAEAARAYWYGHLADLRPELMARLLAHRPWRDEPRWPVERAVCEIALSALLCYGGEFDAAMTAALSARAMLPSQGADVLHAQVALLLSTPLINEGDVEAAIDVLQPALDQLRDPSRFGHTAHFNLLLCLVLAQRLDDAARLLETRPWMLSAELLNALPGLRELVAVVRLHQGRGDEADALLGQPIAEWARRMAAVVANRAWLEAMVHLARQRPAQARQVLEAALAEAETADQPMLASNATQMNRLLAEACEALGDLPAALAAHKRAQNACVGWVGRSVRARLQLMHQARTDGSFGSQERRLKALEAAVRQAQAALAEERASSAQRSRFMAQVVHELRNPIVGVVGLTSMLTLSRLDQRDRQYAELAQGQAQVLLALCNDVLDLAKLEAGRFKLRPSPQDVARLILDTSRQVQPLAELRGLKLTMQIDPAVPPQLMCDPLRLQQVLMNLLSNALKFTLRGSIELDVRWQPAPPGAESGGEPGAQPGAQPDAPRGATPSTPPDAAPDRPREAPAGELQVSVRDTGIGMRPETLATLFESFATSEAPAHGDAGTGNGLGLAVSRQLIERMGGRMAASSAWGQGSHFWFSLPLAQPRPARKGRRRVDRSARPDEVPVGLATELDPDGPPEASGTGGPGGALA